MKKLLLIATVALVGCTNMTPAQQAIATTAANLAQVAVEAAAVHYGGPAAGQLASAGLSGLSSVAQAYLGQNLSPALVQASPGIAGVGAALVPLIASDHAVTQADVDKIARAAVVAAVPAS